MIQTIRNFVIIVAENSYKTQQTEIVIVPYTVATTVQITIKSTFVFFALIGIINNKQILNNFIIFIL